jgi:hypothetical protein
MVVPVSTPFYSRLLIRLELLNCYQTSLRTSLLALLLNKYYITASLVQYVYKILCFCIVLHNKEFVSVLLESAIFQSFYNILLVTFGLATRPSTLRICLLGSVLLFSWHPSIFPFSCVG